MDICPPAIGTAAAFVAVIFLDLASREWRRVPGHALFGAFAVLLMTFICQRGSQKLAWILFSIPIVFILLAWIARAYSQMTKYDDVPEQSNAYDGNAIAQGCPCPCCGGIPCQCMRACPQTTPCTKPDPTPKPKSKCRPKNAPCNEDSYFELWLTTK